MSAAPSDGPAALTEQVRQRYAAAALSLSAKGTDCCGPQALESSEVFGSALYATETTEGLPDEAVLASLGCGNPTAVADLRPGDVVLDLGSGGGIDVLLSARRVGPTGYVFGVDMTDEMLEVAERNRTASGLSNVEFRKGRIEELPLGDATIDVVISNCVVNLSADKPAVLREAARVLRPGGRFGISDVVAEDHLTVEQRKERGSHVGCIAGAFSRTEYSEALMAAGFSEVSIDFTHEVASGMHGAIVKATKAS